MKKYLNTKLKKFLAGGVALLLVAVVAVLGSQQTQFFRGMIFFEDEDNTEFFLITSDVINNGVCKELDKDEMAKLPPGKLINEKLALYQMSLFDEEADLEEFKKIYTIVSMINTIEAIRNKNEGGFLILYDLTDDNLLFIANNVRSEAFTQSLNSFISDRNAGNIDSVINNIIEFNSMERTQFKVAIQRLNSAVSEEDLDYKKKVANLRHFTINRFLWPREYFELLSENNLIEKYNSAIQAVINDPDTSPSNRTILQGLIIDSVHHNFTTIMQRFASLQTGLFSRIRGEFNKDLYPIDNTFGYDQAKVNCAGGLFSALSFDFNDLDLVESPQDYRIEFKVTSNDSENTVFATQTVSLLPNDKQMYLALWSGYCPATDDGRTIPCPTGMARYTINILDNSNRVALEMFNKVLSIGEVEVNPKFEFKQEELQDLFSNNLLQPFGSVSNLSEGLSLLFSRIVESLFVNPKLYNFSLVDTFRLGSEFVLKMKNSPSVDKISTPLYITYKVVEKLPNSQLSSSDILVESPEVIKVNDRDDFKEVFEWDKLCRDNSIPCVPSSGKELYLVLQVTNTNYSVIFENLLKEEYLIWFINNEDYSRGFPDFGLEDGDAVDKLYNDGILWNGNRNDEISDYFWESCFNIRFGDRECDLGFPFFFYHPRYSLFVPALLGNGLTDLLTSQYLTYVFPLEISRPVIGLPQGGNLSFNIGQKLELDLGVQNTYSGLAKVEFNTDNSQCEILGDISDKKFTSTNNISSNCVRAVSTNNFRIRHDFNFPAGTNPQYIPEPKMFSMAINAPAGVPPSTNLTVSISSTPAVNSATRTIPNAAAPATTQSVSYTVTTSANAFCRYNLFRNNQRVGTAPTMITPATPTTGATSHTFSTTEANNSQVRIEVQCSTVSTFPTTIPTTPSPTFGTAFLRYGVGTYTPYLLTPANQATGVAQRPRFTWERAVLVDSTERYFLEVSNNANFSGTPLVREIIVQPHPTQGDVLFTPPTNFQLPNNSVYFWRVRVATPVAAVAPATNPTWPTSFRYSYPAHQFTVGTSNHLEVSISSTPAVNSATRTIPNAAAPATTQSVSYTVTTSANAFCRYNLFRNNQRVGTAPTMITPATATNGATSHNFTTTEANNSQVRIEVQCSTSSTFPTTIPTAPSATFGTAVLRYGVGTYTPYLLTPANQATGVSTTPSFTWEEALSIPVNNKYFIQIADNSNFTNPVNTGVSSTSTTFQNLAIAPLTNNRTYFWRVLVAPAASAATPNNPGTPVYTYPAHQFTVGTTNTFTLDAPRSGSTNSNVVITTKLGNFTFDYMKAEMVPVLRPSQVLSGETARPVLIGAFCNPGSTQASVRDACRQLNLNNESIVGPRDVPINWNTSRLNPGDYQIRVNGFTSTGISNTQEVTIRLEEGRGAAQIDCSFRDVPPTHPQYDQVMTVCEAGFFTGQDTPQGRQADLQSNLIRAESFALACRMRGGDCRTVDRDFVLGFRDLTQGDLNDARRSWMWGPLSGLRGIVRGYGDGTVRMEGFVSQVEFGKLAMESLTRFRVDDRKSPWFTDVVDFYNSCARLNLSDRPATRGEVVDIMYQTMTQCNR